MHFMIFMVVIMALPLLALPVFWFLPLNVALIIYIGGCILSGTMMWAMRRARKTPVQTGYESLIGKETRVVSISPGSRTPYQIQIEGEIWFAASDDSLSIGDDVIITAVTGTKLQIKHINNVSGGAL